MEFQINTVCSDCAEHIYSVARNLAGPLLPPRGREPRDRSSHRSIFFLIRKHKSWFSLRSASKLAHSLTRWLIQAGLLDLGKGNAWHFQHKKDLTNDLKMASTVTLFLNSQSFKHLFSQSLLKTGTLFKSESADDSWTMSKHLSSWVDRWVEEFKCALDQTSSF